MDYKMSRAYINEAGKYGSVLGLKNMYEMMKRLGNPQDRLKYVHVAGTNGKGSLIAYLYSVLSEAGYRIGRYISPAVYSYRERMETAGEPVSKENFAKYITRVSKVIEEMQAEGLPHPTPFEIETAAAFLFFEEEKCDLVLMEVGLGGNLDATNIIETTILSVLVSVSKDHEDFLGKTLTEIAEKKAGIIKSGAKTVSTKQNPEVEAVINRVCTEKAVSCLYADYEAAQVLTEDIRGQKFSFEGEEYEISLAGVHQIENAVLALQSLKVLAACGYETTLEERKRGLRNACWKGRFTEIAEDPLFIVDGAHNPAAAEKLAESVKHYFSGKRIIYIMGMFRDKEYESVIDKTCRYADVIFTIETPENPRSLPAEELAEAIKKFGKEACAMGSLEEAVENAYDAAGKEDVIVAFGSLSYLGELTRIVKAREELKND